MGRHVMNRWWKKGYTWKGLVWAAVAFVGLAVLNLVTRLTVLPNDGWWISSAGMLVLASLWAWRARGLYLFEKQQARARPAEEADRSHRGDGADPVPSVRGQP